MVRVVVAVARPVWFRSGGAAATAAGAGGAATGLPLRRVRRQAQVWTQVPSPWPLRGVLDGQLGAPSTSLPGGLSGSGSGDDAQVWTQVPSQIRHADACTFGRFSDLQRFPQAFLDFLCDPPRLSLSFLDDRRF